MKNPDFTLSFILQTDVPGIGIGAVLSQEENDHPIAYFSRKLLPCERAYGMPNNCTFCKTLPGLPIMTLVHHTDSSLSTAVVTTIVHCSTSKGASQC